MQLTNLQQLQQQQHRHVSCLAKPYEGGGSIDGRAAVPLSAPTAAGRNSTLTVALLVLMASAMPQGSGS
jgi:hypothetical protein